jgi:hypothetical protein
VRLSVSYDIEIELQEHYLFATACGDRTSENVSALAREVLDECVRHKVVNVLLDLRLLTGRLSISESLSVITRVFPEMGTLRKLQRVAVVETSERNERSRFFERAAGSRGYNIKMFEDQKEAVDWLSEHRQPA